MRVFTDIRILFYFIYIQFSRDGYPKKLNNFDFKVSCKNKIGFTTGFFCRKMSVFGCRGPQTSINLKISDWLEE